jgi:hypothetical protein
VGSRFTDAVRVVDAFGYTQQLGKIHHRRVGQSSPGCSRHHCGRQGRQPPGWLGRRSGRYAPGGIREVGVVALPRAVGVTQRPMVITWAATASLGGGIAAGEVR